MKNAINKLFLGALLVSSTLVFAAPSVWNGSSDVSWYEPSAQAYNLINAEQLAGLAKLVNEGTSDFAGKTITLGADIFLNDTTGANAGSWYNVSHRSWTPIGTTSRPFKGEFDGIAGKKNRKIYGLYINSASTNYAGLFGNASNVKISNLDLLVGKIVAKDNVGSLIGYAEGGAVTNVHAETRVSGNDRVGGLVGYFTGNISKSSEKGNVLGRDSVGGIVGITTGSITGTTAANSYFIGNVNGRNYVGGMAGSSGKISNAYAEATISGDSSYVGGIAGLANGLVDSVYYTGGLVKGFGFVGGVVGSSLDSVKYSFSEGDVSGSGNRVGGAIGSMEGTKGIVNVHAKGNVSGGSLVGGVAGYVYGVVDSSYHTDGDVNGSESVGGVVGRIYGPLKNSYSEGNVIGTGSYVGGVAGKVSGEIDSSYHINGNVIGAGSYIGGMAGYASDNVSLSYHSDGYINGTSYVGGLIGWCEKNVVNSYSNGNVTGTGDYVGGVVGLSLRKANTTKNMLADTSFIKNSHSIGDVEGRQFVGGLIGLDSVYKEVLIHSNNCSYNPDTKIHVCWCVNLTSGEVCDTISNNKISPKIIRIVDNSYSKGFVNGSSKVGGLVGAQKVGGDSSAYISNAYRSFEIRSSYHSDGSVTGNSNYVGGIIGYSIGKMDDVHHSGGNVNGCDYVGGLVGKVDSSYTVNSHSEGNVLGGDYVGGIAGYTSGSVAYSHHNNGNIDGSKYVGGLLGFSDSSVTNSHSIGNVKGTKHYVGGLIGLSVRNQNTTNAAKNDTTVLKNSYFNGNVEGVDFVGGLVGLDSVYKKLDKMTSNSIHCHYNLPNTERICDTTYTNNPTSKKIIRLVSNSYSKGNIKGQRYVGGLIGRQNIGSDSSTYILDTTYNDYINFRVNGCSHAEGNVLADSSFAGGLVGYSMGKIASVSHVGGDVSGFSFIGGVAGKTVLSIEKANVEGNIIGKKDYVGGVVGSSNGTVDSSSHIEGDVSGVNFVGGLAGWVLSNLSNSYSEGNVIGMGHYVGGLVGNTDASVLKSYANSNVWGMDSVGGLAGYVGSTITNSYAKGSVKGRNTIGGLVGLVKDAVSASYFEGDSVTGIYQVGGLAGYVAKTVDSSYSTANVKGDDNVGGLIGSAHGGISNSYAIGNVDGDVEHSSAGNDNLGGLVGYQYGGSISKSLALGNVSGTTKLGGLVGRFEGTSISQSYANGNVTGDYYGDPSDEVGNYYIGGLVGYAKGTVNESYASGVVKGIEEDPVYTGCVVGYVNGSLSVSKSYYDKSKCGLGVDGGENSVSVTGSPDKTTTEMQTQSTFVNWDFTDTWMIMENTYPFLQIFANSLLNAVVATESLEGIVYDGISKTPQVTAVSLWNNSLIENVDYSVAYENNVNAGMAKISVCGKGLYNGCKTIQFEIAPATIVPTIAAIDNVVYTGLAFTPEISVYNGESLLDASTYTVEYKDNVNAGTAKIAITMKGNYSGTATKEFNIEKATPVVSVSPQASDITIGQSLARSILSEGVANVSGLFVWKAPGTIPTLVNDGYTVVFAPENDANYNPVEIVVPVVVWDVAYIAVHIDEKTLDSAVVIKGRNYTLPSVPDSVGYDFMGFYKGNTAVGNSGDIVAVNENTVIEAVYKIKTFVVNFVNGELELQSNVLAYGSLPEYTGEMPTKATTTQYSYTFKGWSPTFVNVTGAKTYTAVFDSVVNRYLVTFMDDEKELQSGEVEYGKMPTVPTVTLPENTYSFGGWDKPIVAVTGAVTYYAVINRTLNKYEITFNDYDGSILKAAVQYDYGTPSINIVKPVNPTRRDTVKYTYTFKGWEPIIADVTENAVYTAVYDSTIRSYQVSFVNANDILQSENVLYGEKPVYSGVLPVKSATKQYTYTFKSWNPAVSSVTGAATYTAVFDSVVNKYVVTFMNGDDELQSSAVTYGTVPSAPEVSLPENTIQYTYSFGGWDKPIVAVTGAVTYYAVINRALNKYEIAFKDYDDSVLMASVQYDYGMSSTNIVKPANPTRQETAKYIYTFKGWKPTVEDVTENAVYTAEYDSTIRSYQIVFVNGNDELQSESVVYGNVPTYNGVVPTKQATAQWTYTFKGWNPAISSVAGTATYAAVFDSVINKYGVSFKDYDGSILKAAVQYDYGTSSINIIKPANPARQETAKYIYTFKGWNPTIADVTGNMVYTAEYDSTIKKYTISFINGDKILQTGNIAYGEMPEYIGKIPTKASTKSYSYEFVGWSPKLGSVTKETDFVAVFDSTSITGIVNVANLNMSIYTVSRSVQISAAPLGVVYALLDAQGRVLKKGRVESPNFNILIPQSGTYFIKVGSFVQRIGVK